VVLCLLLVVPTYRKDARALRETANLLRQRSRT
jgi:hypothetical protein